MYLVSFPIGLQAVQYHLHLLRSSSIFLDPRPLLSLLTELISCQLMLPYAAARPGHLRLIDSHLLLHGIFGCSVLLEVALIQTALPVHLLIGLMCHEGGHSGLQILFIAITLKSCLLRLEEAKRGR